MEKREWGFPYSLDYLIDSKENNMPNLTIPLVSMESSIYNDIYFKIIEDVAKIINVDKDTMLILHNSMEVGKTDGRDTARFNRDLNTPDTQSTKKLTVNIRDEFDEDTIGTKTVNQRDSFPIFRDTEIGVSIAPVYINNNMEFEFTYKSASKVDVDQMRDLIRLHLTRAMNVFEHDVEYMMILPEFIEDFICEVHRLKDRLFPIPLLNYVQGYSTNRLLTVTDMSNKDNSLLAVREKQVGVLGEFGFAAVPPEKNTDNSRNQHTLKFTYKVQMEVPKALSVSFPVMICNELVDEKYINIIEEQALKNMSRKTQKLPNVGRSSTVMNNIDAINVHEQMADSLYPINVPYFDDYPNPTKVPGYGPIMTVLCQVDEEDKKFLFNLRDLGDWYLPSHVIRYIEDNLQNVTKLYRSFIYFGIDQRGRYMAAPHLTIDRDLNVRSKIPLNLMRPVRVVMMACIDISYLSEEALTDLVNDDELFETFLLEYLQLKDQFSLNRANYLHARDNRLYRLIINKFRRLLNTGKDDIVGRYIKILETDPMTASNLGEFFSMGYPELYGEILKKELGWVNSIGSLKSFSNEPRQREREIKEAYSYLEGRRRPFSTNGTYQVEAQYVAREDLRQMLQKTVNAQYLVIRSEEETDGNSSQENE